jgi:hypothetical protein
MRCHGTGPIVGKDRRACPHLVYSAGLMIRIDRSRSMTSYKTDVQADYLAIVTVKLGQVTGRSVTRRLDDLPLIR